MTDNRATPHKKWAVFYGNGLVCHSDDHHIWEIPATNVQAIKYEKGNQEQVVSGRDWYVFDAVDQHWYDLDFAGLIERLVLPDRRALVYVFMGRYIPHDAFINIRDAARVYRLLEKKGETE